MKRIFALVMVICMLCVSATVLASCSGGVSLKDFEKDSAAVLAEIMEKTTGNFFESDKNMEEIIASSVDGGSVSIVFASDTLLGDVTSISETLYMNGKDKEVVSDTVVKYDGQDLSGRIFINKDGILFNSASVLGSDKTLALNLSTLADQFKDSPIMNMMFPEEAYPEIEKIVKMLQDEYNAMFAEGAVTEKPDIANELYKILEQKVTEGEKEIDGKKVKTIIVSYTINNATIKALLEKALGDDFNADLSANTIPGEDFTADIPTSPAEVWEMVDENVDINLTWEMNINKKEAVIIDTVVSGEIKNKQPVEGEDDTISFNAVTTYSDAKIATSVDLVCGDESIDFDFSVTKTLTAEELSYKAEFEMVEKSKVDGEVIEADLAKATLTYTHNRANGEFEIKADASFEEDKINVAVKGSTIVEKDSAKLSITSLTYGDVTLNFDLSVTFNKTAEIPARPTDVKDVLELNENDFMEIMMEISESPLGKIIAESQGGYEDFE